VLAIGAFLLSLLGLFLVRSGVITSVHAFASDPRRGVFMLGLIAAFGLGAMALYVRHAARLNDARGPLPTALASRETAVLVNNWLLLVACATVLLGTLYPLALDALRLGKISVGPPYFEAVLAPVFLLLLALLAPVVWLRWGADPDAAARRSLKRLAWGLGAALAAAGLALWLGQGDAHPLAVLTLALAAAVGAATLRWAVQRLRQGGLTASQWGMTVAHLGVAVFAVGVAMVSSYGVERDVRLQPGDTHQLADCSLRFERVQPYRGPNFMALAGRFELACPGEPARPLVAEKRNYEGSAMPMTESAIRWGLTRDLYVALGEPLDGSPYGAWAVRVQVKPFMRWVWAGALLMALGALCSAGARRYRVSVPNRALALEEQSQAAIKNIESMAPAKVLEARA
jgi:cytochrome c-type biogenesis protein CcmF